MQDVFFIHFDTFFLARGAPFFQDGLQLFLGLFFFVAHGSGAFEILVFDGPLFLGLDLFDFAFQPFNLRRAVIVPIRAREPASSIKSMALSGR